MTTTEVATLKRTELQSAACRHFGKAAATWTGRATNEELREALISGEVPAKFANGFPKELALRPSQLRASAAESAQMVPEAWSASDGYGALRMPVVIVAGARDRLIDTAKQSARLHEDVAHSSFHAVAIVSAGEVSANGTAM